MGKVSVFDVYLLCLEKETRQSAGLFSGSTDCLLKDVRKTNLVIIPAIHDDPEKAYEQNKKFASWTVEQHKNAAEVISFCVGAFFLAKTCLLEGKQCATHWKHAKNLKKYPGGSCSMSLSQF